MKRYGLIKRCALFAIFVLLAACADERLVQPGPALVDRIAIDTPLAWSRFAYPRYQIWTIDGIPLNRLYIVPSVKNGESAFLQQQAGADRTNAPLFREGMRPEEIRDILLDALTETGAVDIQPHDFRPARFGDVEGLRFEFEASTAAGLRYRGMVAAAAFGRQLSFLLWMAPAEYYYDRDAASVSRMFDSVRFKR